MDSILLLFTFAEPLFPNVPSIMIRRLLNENHKREHIVLQDE